MRKQPEQIPPSLEDTVTRSYRVGIRFEADKRQEKRQLEKRVNNIVLTLQREAFNKLTPETVDQGVNLVREYPNWSGKTGAGYLAKELGDRSNLGQVSYTALLNACKGTFDRETKCESFISLLQEYPHEGISWLSLGRAPYLEKLFQYRIKTGYDYARNLIVSARKTIDQHLPDEYRLLNIIPILTTDQLQTAFDKFITQTITTLTTLKKTDTLTKNQRVFLNKLHSIKNHSDLMIEVLKATLDEWHDPTETTPQSFWRMLKQCSKSLLKRLKFLTKRNPYRKQTTYFSIIRNIIVTAIRHYYDPKETTECPIVQMLQEQQILRPQNLVSKPYRKKRNKYDKKIPLSLVMGSKFVVGRPGNSKVLTELAKTEAQFDLTFWYPRKKKTAISGTIRFHKSLKRYLDNGASIKLLVLEAGPPPAQKVYCTIVLTGTRRMFMTTKAIEQFKFPKTLEKTAVLGLDINRIGEYTVAYSQDFPLPSVLLELCKRYNQLTKRLPQLYRLKTRAYNSMIRNHTDQTAREHTKRVTVVRQHFTKRNNLLREIEHQIGHLTSALLVQTEAQTLAVEELNCSTRNTKGALAKAIASMPDDNAIYVNAVLRAEFFSNKTIFLETVDPAYTSNGIHIGCSSNPAGKLKRTPKHYDNAPCSHCSQFINTHVNAAKILTQRALKQQTDRIAKSFNSTPHRTPAGGPPLRSPV